MKTDILTTEVIAKLPSSRWEVQRKCISIWRWVTSLRRSYSFCRRS